MPTDAQTPQHNPAMADHEELQAQDPDEPQEDDPIHIEPPLPRPQFIIPPIGYPAAFHNDVREIAPTKVEVFLRLSSRLLQQAIANNADIGDVLAFLFLPGILPHSLEYLNYLDSCSIYVIVTHINIQLFNSSPPEIKASRAAKAPIRACTKLVRANRPSAALRRIESYEENEIPVDLSDKNMIAKIKALHPPSSEADIISD